MNGIFKISEAASLALHSMVLIKKTPAKLNATEIADILKSSKHHVAKVLQRLVKSGMLDSGRGPKGGFEIKKNVDEISFLDIYQAIEGNYTVSNCIYENKECMFDTCIIGDLNSKLSNEFIEYLKNQKLSSF
jgi:Rrf2 family protein